MNRIGHWNLAVILAVGLPVLAGCQQTAPSKSQNSVADEHQIAVTDEYQIAVTDNGFEPAETRIPLGKPVTLVMTRKTDQTCATEVVFASLNQRFKLPLNQPVRITLPASEGGTVSYECGMKMLGGRIVIR